MPNKNRQELYNLFTTGNKPTQDDFADLIDSMVNIVDDGIGVSEKGNPLELVQQGTKERYLDLSSAHGSPVWRISAQSGKGTHGLNFATADEKSRFFIRKDNGCIGINNGDPKAKLHITPDSGTTLLVEDLSGHPLLQIDADGNVGIGTEPEKSFGVSLGGKVNFTDNASLNGSLSVEKGVIIKDGAVIETGRLEAKSGLTVNGGAGINGKLTAQQGLTVNQGITVETGQLAAKGGLTVNGGAVIETGKLEAQQGLTVNQGITVETGKVQAKKGLSVYEGVTAESGKVEAKAGLTVNGGALIETGKLEAQQGLTVNQGVTVETGQLTAKGGLTANGGAVIETGKLEARQGLTVNQGITVETGKVVAQNGLTVNGGAVIENGSLAVKDELTVDGATTIENGVLLARGGISVPEGSMLTVDGSAILGNEENGSVMVNGELIANNGAVVSGGELVVMNGVRINGDLDAPYTSTLGNAVINNLHVNDINIMGTIDLQSVNLNLLQADRAEIGNMTTGKTVILGTCQTCDHVLFDSGQIYLSYTGPVSIKPKFRVVKGTVTGEPGHFEFVIDDDKNLTVIYDESSEFEQFLLDWEEFQAAHPDQTAGFLLLNAGARSWELRDQEVGLMTTGTYKEHILNEYGLSVIHTGPATDAPSFEIKANEDLEKEGFVFLVDGQKLIIKYPAGEENRTVEQLFLDWQTWFGENLETAGYFELRKTPDFAGERLVNDLANTVLSVNTNGYVFSKAIIKTNTVKLNGLLQFDGTDVLISGVSKDEDLAENSDTLLSTQKAVKTYVDRGLALKADQAFVANELEKKADQTYVDAGLMNKADQSFVTGELNKKANQSFVVEELEKKANLEDVDTRLAEKANQDFVTGELAKKADLSTMVTALATKVNLAASEKLLVAQGASVTVDGIGLSPERSGLLLVTVNAVDHVCAGLFALDGTESLIKIAGDGVSDRQDEPETCNLYLHEGTLMLQNALPDGIMAKVIYFGT